MIRPLRTYHFYIWQGLAVLLPVLFCLSIALRPDSPSGYRKVEKDDFSFTLTKLSNDTGRLTVELKNSLKVPSCVVYLSSPPQNLLLGKIDHVGSHHFDIPLTTKTVNIQLYDPIHSIEITLTELSYQKE